MESAPRHIVCVSGLVRDSTGRVLLVRNDRGWEMPGGQVEVGEDPLVALRREVKEEASCTVEVGRLFGLYSNLTMGLVILAFECSYTGGTPRGGMECSEASWHEPEAAVRAAAHTPARQRISDGLAADGRVVIRSYSRKDAGSFETQAERRL